MDGQTRKGRRLNDLTWRRKADAPTHRGPPKIPAGRATLPAETFVLPDDKDDHAECPSPQALPAHAGLDWGRDYDRDAQRPVAAVIVTIMLIPQSLAYALLAGLPPEAGIYASILPIILYAIFGTSRALAVGPVAVVSLMTAAAVGPGRRAGHAGYARPRSRWPSCRGHS
jgi:hypothetical protein